MKKPMRSLVYVLSFFISSIAFAATPGFTNLSQGDVENIVKDFGGVFTHTSVSPASSLGKVFGFEVGLVAGAAKTPEVETLAKASDPNTTVSALPQAGLLGAFSVPLGFKFEALLLPEKKLQDVTVKYASIAVQWTLSDVFPLPLDLAFKLHHAGVNVSYDQNVGGVQGSTSIDEKINGLAVLVSKSFLFIEPYLGFGVLNADGEIAYTGTSSIFTIPAGSYSKKVSGSQAFIGANVGFGFFRLGLEVGRAFGNDKADLKLSFVF